MGFLEGAEAEAKKKSPEGLPKEQVEVVPVNSDKDPSSSSEEAGEQDQMTGID